MTPDNNNGSDNSDENTNADNINDGVETTGHVWDGIEELNTPLPRWWLWVLYATIIWGVAYMIVMPAVPIPGGDGWSYTKGVIGYSQRDVVRADIARSKASRAVYEDRIATADLAEIRSDKDLLNVSLAGGAAAFGDNCAPCHGSGAQGFTGFPNLNDDDWLWGGSLDDIHATIAHGIRWEHDDETRFSQMPRFKDDELLNDAEISDVVQFVLSISGSDHDAARVTDGAVIYQDQCSFCHGESGEGDRSQGAPNLSDALWLFGGDEASLTESVARGRFGVMPSWSGRLSDATVKELALYVHALGGGE
jgi:cytochrome c oxidase cbb3-type subunit 3